MEKFSSFLEDGGLEKLAAAGGAPESAGVGTMFGPDRPEFDQMCLPEEGGMR